MKSSSYSTKQRLGYWFDNFMAQGMWAKIRLLLLVTLVFIVLFGALVFLIDPERTLADGIWTTLLMVLGKGIKSDITDHGSLHALLMMLVVFYAMFFMATLIGLINTGLRSKIDDLGKGHGVVLEEGHTLILGFNDTTFTLIDEIIQANENQVKQQCVCVLDEMDQAAMEEAIAKRFGPKRSHPQTRIICRTGSCSNFDDLYRCSILSSKSVVVNTKTDFETIKALMACTYVMNNSDVDSSSYCVAVIHSAENEAPAQIAGLDGKEKDRLELLPMQDVLARIIVHTSRQPGLASVFTELFNFSGHEIYIIDSDPAFKQLYGKTIAEINLSLKTTTAIGSIANGEDIDIGDPRFAVFQEGDSLIVIAEDDDPLVVGLSPVKLQSVQHAAITSSSTMRGLILGAYEITDDVLAEFLKYLQDGSSLYVVDTQLDASADKWETWKKRFTNQGVAFEVRAANTLNRRTLHAILGEVAPDSVLVLSDALSDNPEARDKDIMSLLLYLREYRVESGRDFAITSQMNLEANRELASATSPDDYIVGRHIAALLMAQISQNRKMRDLFSEFLSSEGFEVYIKKASNYVVLGEEIDLYSVGAAVAARGDIFIGVRQLQAGRYEDAVVNPPKYLPGTQQLAKYNFSSDDYFVVLSQDMDFFD